jgi:hypothetical protein
MRSAFLLLLAATSAWAQLTGPMLGWTPDGSHIRPMYGLAGAAALGDPIALGRDLAVIAPSSSGNYVIATAADNGQALLIVNGTAASLNGVAAGATRISISPNGGSAALWFRSPGHFQIVTGLPGAPSVRDLDASSANGDPTAFAVTDDGQSLAASWPTGSWLFDANGANPLPLTGQIDAIAFLPNQSEIVAATSQGVVSIANGNTTTLYGWSREPAMRRPLSPFVKDAPVGIAASFDGGHVVIANKLGYILDLNLASHTSSLSQCACAPEGVFGLGSATFRLNSLPNEVKIYDASSQSIFVVPPTLPAVPPDFASHSLKPAALPALPAVTIGGIPTSTGYSQQPAMTITLASAYSVDITGTVTLAFVSAVGGDDQMIQFVSPVTGRTAPFTIAAGSTQASFSGKSSLMFSTGTVAGTTTLTLEFTASGTDITPAPAPKTTYITNPTVPFISNVTLSQTTGGVTVVVTGFSSSRDMTSGSFVFAPASGTTISDPTVTVPLTSAFSTWYSSAASNAFGSQFKLTVPFPVQGLAGNIVAVTVTLTNSKGNATPVSQ